MTSYPKWFKKYEICRTLKKNCSLNLSVISMGLPTDTKTYVLVYFSSLSVEGREKMFLNEKYIRRVERGNVIYLLVFWKELDLET